jgi:sigma-70-like protein
MTATTPLSGDAASGKNARREDGQAATTPASLDDPVDAVLLRMKHTTRLDNLVGRLGLVTVRDIVRMHPDLLLLEPNLGRRTIAETDKAIRLCLGVSWEEARHRLTEPRPQTWKEILASLPDVVRRFPVHPTLPTRLANSCKRLGARTIGDLALLPDDPCKWPQAGRKSADALPGILDSLRSLPVEGDAPSSPETKPWKEILARLPVDVRRLPLSPALPTRLARGCAQLGVRTIGELAQLPDDPSRWPKVGRISSEALVAILESLRDDPLDGCASWSTLLRKVVGGLKERERHVLGMRATFDGREHTLEDVGSPLGLSRERVRQIERDTIARLRRTSPWSVLVAERLTAIVGESLLTLAELAERDPFFAVSRGERRMFVFFVSKLLKGPLVVARLGRDLMVSRLSADEIDARLAELRDEARRVPYPVAESDLHATLAQRLGWDVGLARALAQTMRREWTRHGARVTGFGKGHTNAQLALLRARSEPVALAELKKRFGRGAHLPKQAVSVGGGRVTLRERLPEWDAWSERIGAVCAAAMREGDPHRQWTAAELMALLRQGGEDGLPPWCSDVAAFISLLRNRADLRYLGRGVFSVGGEQIKRLKILDAIVALLEEEGAPMTEEKLVAQIQSRRGFARTTWATIRFQHPLVRFGDGRIGLSPRDVPGGEKAIAAASRAVFAKLLWNQAEMDAEALRRVVARLGPPFRAWSTELLRSILRHDDAFVFTKSHEVGLSEWGS